MTRTRKERTHPADARAHDDDARSQRMRELDQKINLWRDEIESKQSGNERELQTKIYRARDQINRLYVQAPEDMDEPPQAQRPHR